MYLTSISPGPGTCTYWHLWVTNPSPPPAAQVWNLRLLVRQGSVQHACKRKALLLMAVAGVRAPFGERNDISAGFQQQALATHPRHECRVSGNICIRVEVCVCTIMLFL